MSAFGISMVRDEADVIGPVLEHMIHQVDQIIVIDNGSIDGTRDILAGFPIEVIDDGDLAYYQSQKMTTLAHLARERGAEWVVPFDADEVWYSPFAGRLARTLEDLDADIRFVQAPLFDHVATAADPKEDANPLTRLGWRRREPAPLPKCAARVSPSLTLQQGNHGVTYADATAHRFAYGELVVRHFPYRSPEQMVSKVRNGAAAYAATDLPESMGQHWRDYGRILDAQGPTGIEDVFRTWFWSEEPVTDKTLIYDPAPL